MVRLAALLPDQPKKWDTWKVGDINPVSVLGVDGYPYGFNLTAGDGHPLVSFAYVTRAKAEEAPGSMRLIS